MLTRLFLAVTAASFLVACGTAASDREVAPDPNAADTTTTTTVTTTTRAAAPAAAARPAAPRESGDRPATAPRVSARRDATIPAGTALRLRLNTAVASDTSHEGDSVTAELADAVVVDGRTLVPAGASLTGSVSDVADAGRVKGRGRVTIDFTALTSGGARYALSAEPISEVAAATKGEDAAKIGVGAGAGAIIGGILGGKKGSAKGAVIGGGAGTGVVLATAGKEARMDAGTLVSTQLTAPLSVRLP